MERAGGSAGWNFGLGSLEPSWKFQMTLGRVLGAIGRAAVFVNLERMFKATWPGVCGSLRR